MKDSGNKTKPANIGDVIKSRRTINFYQQRHVPISLIRKAIDIARWAPNHKKTEPWHFYLLGKKTRRQAIELITEIKSGAKGESLRESTKKRLDGIPGWLVLSSDLSGNPIIRRENYAACCCAAQNLMLYLWNNGIGVKWTTGEVTRDKRFYKLLGIDRDDRRIVGLFWYGYPSLITRQTRKPGRDITTRLE